MQFVLGKKFGVIRPSAAIFEVVFQPMFSLPPLDVDHHTPKLEELPEGISKATYPPLLPTQSREPPLCHPFGFVYFDATNVSGSS